MVNLVLTNKSNKMAKKIIIIIAIAILAIFTIYITEESIRLKHKIDDKPLIVTDRTKICLTCLEPGEEVDFEWISLGYKVKVKYYMSERSSEDLKLIHTTSKEFLLFNKIRLWAWISDKETQA